MPLVTFDDRKIDIDVEGGTNSLRLGNTLLQWGTKLASSSATTSITFNKTYSSPPYIWLTVNGVTRTLDVRTPQLSSVSTSDFSFFVTGANGGSNYYSETNINWLAIGTV